MLHALRSPYAPTQHAAAWAVKYMAAHGAHAANQIAAAEVLPALVALVQSAERCSQEAMTAHTAVEEIVARCALLSPVLTIVKPDAPPDLLAAALQSCLRMMRDSVAARREFVTSGALKVLQHLAPCLDRPGQDTAQALNSLFPVPVVEYYRQQGAPSGAAPVLAS